MSELQAESQDQSVETEVDQDNLDAGQAGSELAPDSAEEREEKDPAKVAQENAQKAINKQHAKYREEERKRIAAEEQAKELEDRLQKLEAQNNDVIVPDAPDPYDEDFEAKLAARDEALLRKARLDAASEAKKAQLSAQSEAAQKAENDRIQGLVEGYGKRVTTLGLDAGEVNKAANMIADYGLGADLEEFLLSDEDGPLMTLYLMSNPIELDELRSMSPIQAALKLDSTIRTASSALKPQASAAPDPAEVLSGRGAGEKVSPFVKGAKFE